MPDNTTTKPPHSNSSPSEQGKLSWTVRFTIDPSWVADGFEITDERAFSMLLNELINAYPEEIAAKVISAPHPERIKRLQGGAS